ncbi:MAG: transglutaminase domain-containing protein [Candidatus Kapaibacteriota bacterium]
MIPFYTSPIVRLVNASSRLVLPAFCAILFGMIALPISATALAPTNNDASGATHSSKEMLAKETLAKEALAKESISFAAIDQYAQRVPQHIATQSLPKLVAYLTKPAANDIEKARSIARWITSNVSYDFEAAANEKNRPSDNADSVFMNRKALESGFAALFLRMMHAAGVETFVVSGLKKGFNFAPGDASTLKRHTWNAFRTSGKWYLVDLPVYKEVETDGSYKLTYADAFFCIAPEQMIYTSFPDDKRWQLLDEPISKEQFLNSVQCFGAYHGYFITPLSHREYAIAAKQRTLTLSFDAPSGLHLGARVYAEKDAREQYSAIKTTREGRKLTVHVKFPADGAYKLEITAKEFIRERGTNEVVGCSVKTVAEYSVNVGDKQARSMAVVRD